MLFKKVYLWLCWVFLAALVPSFVASEGYTLAVIHRALLAGASRGAQALGKRASVLAMCGLSSCGSQA